MLTLVAPGPKLIAVRTTQQSAMVQYLTAHFMCEPMAQLGLGVDTTKTLCVLCVIDELAGEQQVVYLGVAQPAEYVLCHLMDGDAQQMITHIRALPPSIVFNSLGEHQPVVDKIQLEFSCECSDWSTLLYKENDEGVIVTFLLEDGPGQRKFYDKALFVRQEFTSLLAYLRIHAPRYLAKAFAPNAWHMVDLRIYDRYEVYDLQYKRLLKAIQALKLGYVVTEAWNREISAFSDPVGTYQIRLLTFLPPLELKKLLIALEYSQSGSRVVDLDLIWHKKKISWKDLLDDKETRKQIKQTAAFFPKSNFFAVQNDKAALVKYCTEAAARRMEETDGQVLHILEEEIAAKALEG